APTRRSTSLRSCRATRPARSPRHGPAHRSARRSLALPAQAAVHGHHAERARTPPARLVRVRVLADDPVADRVGEGLAAGDVLVGVLAVVGAPALHGVDGLLDLLDDYGV